VRVNTESDTRPWVAVTKEGARRAADRMGPRVGPRVDSSDPCSASPRSDTPPTPCALPTSCPIAARKDAAEEVGPAEVAARKGSRDREDSADRELLRDDSRGSRVCRVLRRDPALPNRSTAVDRALWAVATSRPHRVPEAVERAADTARALVASAGADPAWVSWVVATPTAALSCGTRALTAANQSLEVPLPAAAAAAAAAEAAVADPLPEVVVLVEVAVARAFNADVDSADTLATADRSVARLKEALEPTGTAPRAVPKPPGRGSAAASAARAVTTRSSAPWSPAAMSCAEARAEARLVALLEDTGWLLVSRAAAADARLPWAPPSSVTRDAAVLWAEVTPATRSSLAMNCSAWARLPAR
jgi:hypothetical protein